MLKGKKFDAFALFGTLEHKFETLEHKFQTIEHRIILSKKKLYLPFYNII